MWHIHATNYYSALQRKEILIHDTTWMNPEDILLSEMRFRGESNSEPEAAARMGRGESVLNKDTVSV